MIILLLISATVRVTFWHAMGGPLGRTLDDLIMRFNREHPDIEVISVNMGNYSTLSQKLMASIVANRPPTMAQAYESWISSLWRAGKLEPIENFARKDFTQADWEDFFPVLLANSKWGDTLVSLPFNKSVTAYFYNKDWFREKGITEFPRTWDEFLGVALKLRDTLADKWATAFSPAVSLFEMLLFSCGGQILDSLELYARFDDSCGVWALSFICDLLHKYKVAYLTTGYQYQDDFITQKVAMVVGSSVSYSYIMRYKPPFELGMAPIPDSGCIIMGTNIVIFRAATPEQKRAAWEFIKWFTSPEIQAEWAIATGYVPVRRSAFTLPIMQAELRKVPDRIMVWRQIEYAHTEPRTAGWLAGRQFLLTEGIEPALRNVLSPRQALTRAAKIVEFELKKY